MMTRVVPVRNIYLLLAYAARDIGVLGDQEIGEVEAGDDFEILARLLDVGMRRIFRRGLDKRYIELEERGTHPRGALDVDRTIGQLLHLRGELAFRVDDRLPDTHANQVLRTALRFAMRSERLAPKLKRRLRAHATRLHGVSDISPRKALSLSPKIPRGLHEYRPVLRVAELCLARALPDEGAAGHAWRKLLDDEEQMGRLFEGFVRGFAKCHFGERARVSGKEFRWPKAEFSERGAALIPKMITDVFIDWRAGPPTIGECKFYKKPFVHGPHGGPSKLHSQHLYQLMAYLRAADREYDGKPSGLLVYATVDETVSERMEIDGYDFGVVSLDLARAWPELREQMTAVVEACAPPQGAPRYSVAT